MPQHPRGEGDGILSSFFMFILQVFCVALFSGLFFLVLIPREEQAECRKRPRIQGFDVDGNDRKHTSDARRVDRSRRSRVSADHSAYEDRPTDLDHDSL